MITLLVVSLLMQSSHVERIEFDVQWVHGEKSVTARLAVNRKSDQEFVMSCRKAMTGSFFIFWATPTGDVLYLPNESRAFVGDTGPPIQLFPNGPRLTREEWLAMLLLPASSSLNLEQQDSWWVIEINQPGVAFKFKERRRSVKKHMRSNLFQPTIRQGTEVLQWEELARFWGPPSQEEVP